jgi:hypothetical protein
MVLYFAWDKFPYEKPTVKKLQCWCDRFLATKQWKQLQAVIRVGRRDPSRYRTVRLSRNAHEILMKLAMRDKLTLSEVIERYLSRMAHVPAPAQAVQIAEQPSRKSGKEGGEEVPYPAQRASMAGK